VESTSDDTDDDRKWGFTVQRGEFEGARGAVRGEEVTGKRSLKEFAVMIGALGPWALNQFWMVPTGQAEISGALNGLNFIKGSNPGREGGQSIWVSRQDYRSTN
jgi:hypothetical protein